MSQPSALDEKKFVEVTAADLPLHCPLPSQALWNKHPRVFLPIEMTGEARCPYCSTLYKLVGPVSAGH
jgi:uncharacterized Zn-finger protein